MSLESFQAPVDRVAIREPISGVIKSLLVVEGKGKSIATDEQVAQSLLELQQPNGKSKEASHTMSLEERTAKLDEDQAGSDPGTTFESRPPLDEDQARSNLGQCYVALAGPNPEPMHEDFIATIYPKVHKCLKHTTEEHVLLENPSSSFGTLSSMKNLDDAFTYEFEMKEIHYDQMFESGSYRSQPKHTTIYEALEASMDCKNRDEFVEEKAKSHIEDTDAAHLLKIRTIPYLLKPVPEEEKPKTHEPDWAVPPNNLPKLKNSWANALAISQIGKKKLSKADLEGPAFKVYLANPEGNRVVPDVSKPLPLGGPLGQVTIQSQYIFNKDLEYLVSGDKDRRNALLISKLKVTYYPDFRLEELVVSLWIKSEREYDISVAYGIPH
nr:hypothetical protein [Tanacetum cinerariifolium]GEX49128.1 hypothetical protein [Tanacetum cinerariifolium]